MPSPHFFQRSYGPTRNCSQWHLKKYVLHGDDDYDDIVNGNYNNDEQQQEDEKKQSIMLKNYKDESSE